MWHRNKFPTKTCSTCMQDIGYASEFWNSPHFNKCHTSTKKLRIANNIICKGAITTIAAPPRTRVGDRRKKQKLMSGRLGRNFCVFRRRPSPTHSARSSGMTFRQATTCLCLLSFPGPLKYRKESHAPRIPTPSHAVVFRRIESEMQ